jgi:hypothetical protein
LYFLSLPPLGGRPFQTFPREPFVRVDCTIEFREIEMLVAGVCHKNRARPEQQRRSPPIEKWHVGGEPKGGGRKAPTVCSLTIGTRNISSDVTNRSSGWTAWRIVSAGPTVRKSTSADADGEITLGAIPPSIKPIL